jgi:hypothetical protein
MLSGAFKRRGVPAMAMGCCDVRDVAEAHIQVLLLDAYTGAVDRRIYRYY